MSCKSATGCGFTLTRSTSSCGVLLRPCTCNCTGLDPVDVLLLMAASENDTPKVEELLSAGANVNIADNTGKSPMDLATKPEVKTLLEVGTIRNGSTTAADEHCIQAAEYPIAMQGCRCASTPGASQVIRCLKDPLLMPLGSRAASFNSMHNSMFVCTA